MEKEKEIILGWIILVAINIIGWVITLVLAKRQFKQNSELNIKRFKDETSLKVADEAIRLIVISINELNSLLSITSIIIKDAVDLNKGKVLRGLDIYENRSMNAIDAFLNFLFFMESRKVVLHELEDKTKKVIVEEENYKEILNEFWTVINNTQQHSLETNNKLIEINKKLSRQFDVLCYHMTVLMISLQNMFLSDLYKYKVPEQSIEEWNKANRTSEGSCNGHTI